MFKSLKRFRKSKQETRLAKSDRLKNSLEDSDGESTCSTLLNILYQHDNHYKIVLNVLQQEKL